MNRFLRFSKCLAPFWLLVPAVLQAAEPAGRVVMLTGLATALRTDGTVRKLAKNDAVFVGDLINSGLGSYVNLRFEDGGFFLLRPETRFEIEDFQPPAPAAPVVSPTPPSGVSPVKPLVTTSSAPASGGKAFFRLLKGGFRSVSGLVGKLNQNDYRVTTPVATIGIRGTKYSARLCPGVCEDRSQIVTRLQSVGKAVAADDLLLVTTVDDGSIEVRTDKTSTIQHACSAGTKGDGGSDTEATCNAMFTSPDGSITITPARPDTENSERNLDPGSCS